MKILLLILGTIHYSLSVTTCGNDGTEKCEVVHFIDSKNFNFQVGDTIESNGILYIPLDCEGRLKVLEYYSQGELYSETFFEGFIQEKELLLADEITFQVEKKRIKFFKRVASGKWIYYHPDGSTLKTVSIK